MKTQPRRLIRTLLVEDDQGFAENVRLFLDDAPLYDYQITHVLLFRDAEQRLLTQHFGMVILDLNLPNGRGTKLIERARKLYPNGPLVVYTGQTDREVEVAGIEANATQFFFKSEFRSAEDFQHLLRIAMARHKAVELTKGTDDAIEALGSGLGIKKTS